MTQHTYGAGVYDLAENFIDDMDLEAAIANDEDADKKERGRLTEALAAHIQRAIEDFTSSPEIFAPKEPTA